MLIYLLGRLRKLLKSIGKKEKTLVHLINYQKFKKKRSNYVINNEIVDLYKESNERIKIAAVITFFLIKIKFLI